MRASIVLFLVLFQLANSLAEEHKLTVRTFPPGARMTDQYDGYLGETGRPVVITWGRSDGTLELRMSLEGYRDAVRTVSYRELEQPFYPSEGTIALPPANWRVATIDFLRYRWYYIVLGLIGIGGLGWQFTRARSAVSHKYPKFGRYQATEIIGRGGTSVVYAAVGGGMDGKEKVAVKVLHDLGPTARQRFEREVKVCLEYQHPHLMQIYDWGTHTDDRLFLVCEFLQGEVLSEVLESKGQLEPSRVADILEALGKAVTYLHQRGVAHRDVKPGNVFVCDSGRIKLLDLGIAKSADFAPITQTGMAVGTPHYMAPEQIQGHAEMASDQYALGVMAYEMLVGERPFKGRDVQELYKLHLNGEPPTLDLPDCSPLADAIIKRMMAKAPKNRFDSVDAALVALAEALRGDSELGDDTEIG